MELLQQIQKIVQNCVKGLELTESGYATVLSARPLRLEIQATRMQVCEPVALDCENVRRRTQVINGEEIVVNPGLEKGDKVLYLKVNSGQNYIILSKA